jgi:hypothetical protein
MEEDESDTEKEMSENQQYVYDAIVSQIRMGFKSPDEIFEYLSEMVEDEEMEDEIDMNWVKENLDREYTARVKASETEWGYPTDPLRLADAFEELRSLGIIALHNAGYTISDGESDVVEIEHALREEGIVSEGYCFYHEQDLERAIDLDDPMLHLAFQKIDNSDPEVTAKVGKTVVEVLQKHHLNVDWNGDVNKRIIISPILWNKVYEEEDMRDFSFGRAYHSIIENYNKD